MTIDIACGATDGYLPHLGVMLHSLLARTPHRPLRIWLMTAHSPPPQDYHRLQQVVSGAGGDLQILDITPAMMEGIPPSRYFHRSVWHRVLLPDLLADVPRVLYLDADMVIAQDLETLWHTPLNGCLFGAVTAPFYPGQPIQRTVRLGLPEPGHYVSSGVLLLDLDALRRVGAVASIKRYAAAHPDNPCPEQDALNALYHTRCLRLHPRWNVQPIFFDLPAERLPLPPALIAEAVQAPAVIHYSGTAKPWHYLSKHPLRHLYFESLKQTPWPAHPLEGRTMVNRLLRPMPAAWQFRAFRGIAAWRALRERTIETLRRLTASHHP